MEFKGTKGKWSLEYDSFFEKQVIKRNCFTICNINTLNDESIWKANALLMSKAPEMLEMLIDAVNEKKSGCNISDGWYIRVEKLIKEATEI